MIKRKNNLSLNSDEDLLVNYFYYDNEMLLMYLDLEFKKLINRTITEIENNLKLFDTYNDSIDFKNNVYLYLPFKYTNIELEIIFSRLFNYDIKEMDYYSLIKLFLKSEESKKIWFVFKFL